MANLLRKGNRTEPAVPPAPTRAPAVAKTSTNTGIKKLDAGDFTPWDLAQIWIESIEKEHVGRKQWDQMHGWMADYDPKGNLKPRKATPENSTRFSNTVPNSRGHDYGWHLQSGIGQEIQHLQSRFDQQYKKRVSKEVLGYD